MKRHNGFMLIVCIALFISMFSGCSESGGIGSSKNTKSKQESKQAKKAKSNSEGKDILWQDMVVVTNPEFYVNSDMWLFQEMEKSHKMNFHIKMYGYDQWDDQKSLMFASNELPDVLMSGLTNDEIVTYSEAGQIMPITSLLKEHAPNYVKCLEKYPDGKKLYAPDGEMYGMAGTFTGGSAETPGARCFINKKWADVVGKELPHTYEEFYALLKAFKDSDPKGTGEEVYPLSGVVGSYQVDPFVANPLGIQLNQAGKSQFQAVDGKIQHLINMPVYQEYLQNMRQLYDEKLLDNEYYTQNVAQFRAKGANLQLGAYTDDAHFINVGTTDPKIYGQYEVTYPLTSDYQKEPVWYGDVVSVGNIYLTSDNKNPEKTIEYMDYFWTEDGCKLIVGPVKGEWDGEGGIIWNEDKTSFHYEIPEGYNGVWEWLCKEVSVTGFLQGYSQYSEIKSKEEKAPEDASFKDMMEERIAPYVVPNFPTLFFTPREQEKITLILDDVTTYFDQMEAKMVMGDVPIESGIEETRSYLEGSGLDDLVAVYQTAYDRYMSN